MKKVELYIVPYAKDNEIKTHLVVDGSRIVSKDNRLTNLVVYQPMRKWLNPYKKKLFVWDGLLAEIIEELNDPSIRFDFFGCHADFTMFRKCILTQQAGLNRNGAVADVDFEFTDRYDFRQTFREMISILDDLRIEADNWGEDEIMEKIDSLKDFISSCRVTLQTRYITSPDAFGSLLRKHGISETSQSNLTVIPVDGLVPVSGFREFLNALGSRNEADQICLVINASTGENEALFEAVVTEYNAGASNLMYLESSGENCIPEIMKLYHLAVFPAAKQKAAEILQLFPDRDSNSYLIDISERLDDLLFAARFNEPRRQKGAV